MLNKYYLFLLVLLGANTLIKAQTTIAKQSFETSGDTWTPITFSTPPCTLSGDIWDYSTAIGGITPSDGSQFWGIQDLNGNCGGVAGETITLPDVNISGYTSVTLSFDYNVFEFDNGDDLIYTVYFDSVSQGDITIVNGSANFSTSGWITETINVPASVSNVSLVLFADQNGGGDYGGFDNIVLEGIAAAPCITPTSQPSSLTFSNITNSSFDGSFSASIPSSDNYLVVYSTNSTLGANPINTTNYTIGDTIGSGIVAQSGGATTFSITSLNPSTTYYVFIFSYNSACVGGPVYNTLNPLINNETTISGPCLDESFTSTTFQPVNWLAAGVVRSTNAADYNTAPAAATFNANNGYLTTSAISNPSSLSFYLGRSGNSTAKTLNVNVSTTGQTGPFTNIAVFDHSNVPSGSYNQYTVDLSAYTSNANVWLQFEKVSSTTSPWRFDDVTVTCGSSCTPSHSITSFSPTSGPAGSEITITGTGFTNLTTVSFNTINANVNFVDATTVIAEVPANSSTGTITVTENGCDLQSSTDYTVLFNSGSCIASTFTDLIISEVYDSTSGNGWYMELYNPTSSSIDLDAAGTDFEIERYGDIGDASPSRIIDVTGVIAPNSVFTLRIGSASPHDCNAISYDFTELNSGINENDEIRLTKNGVQHDVVYCPNDTGYSILRNNTANGPSTTYNGTEWTTNTTESCSDLGAFSVPASTFPSVNAEPVDVSTCGNYVTFNTTASPGNSGSLTYQWYFNDSASSGWSIVNTTNLPGLTITGETTDALTLTGTIASYSNYQFYCSITENGTCTTVSNAAQIKIYSTIWNGSTWSNGNPSLSVPAIINSNYLTNTHGSFSACSLVINNSFRLTVDNNTYVEIENSVTVDGELFVQPQGAFVQNNNSSTFTLNSNGTSLVNKMTTPLNSVHEYTYWSSPVSNLMVQDGLAFAHPWRRYWFDATNFLDEFIEINNTNTFTPGSDGIDDDGDDWTPAADTDIMTPGKGYIAMHNPTGFVAGSQYTYIFEGAFNNGIINAPIAYNGANGDEDWNLIGNPYPSAIDANQFLTDNASIVGGAIYLWSQNTAANGNTSGNEGANFAQGDYAIITNGSGNTAGGDMIIPNNFVPSGQSFFIQGLANGNAVFSNAYRMADATSNSQFFKNSTSPNRLWLNLTSDNGVFNQILVAYVNGATDGKDNTSFDAKASIYNLNAAVIYTEIENETDRYTIQGKAPESLTIDEIIPVGFETVITEPTLYTFSIAQFEGLFFDNNTVYLKDNLLNITHDLSANNYSFTSGVGNFNDRFEIVFQTTSLSTEDFNLNAEEVSIIEIDNGNVKFNLHSKSLTIESINIIDMLGRTIYQFRGSENIEIFNLSNLSSSAYIAKIALSNGRVITKKAIKK